MKLIGRGGKRESHFGDVVKPTRAVKPITGLSAAERRLLEIALDALAVRSSSASIEMKKRFPVSAGRWLKRASACRELRKRLKGGAS